MPTYTYKLEDGTTFDLQQKISADALTTCPTTGQAVKRVITGGGGVVYKGDGWYVTDYKNKGPNPAGSAPQPRKKAPVKKHPNQWEKRAVVEQRLVNHPLLILTPNLAQNNESVGVYINPRE